MMNKTSHTSVLFDTLINEFTDILETVKKDKSVLTVEILKDAESIIQSMKIEIHSKNIKNKKAGKTIINDFEKNLCTMRKEILLSRNTNDYVDVMIKSNEISRKNSTNDTIKILQDSTKKLTESEEIGCDTLVRLQEQKDTLIRVKNNISEVQADLNKSNSWVSSMLSWWR
jgi:hypothetical protein